MDAMINVESFLIDHFFSMYNEKDYKMKIVIHLIITLNYIYI